MSRLNTYKESRRQGQGSGVNQGGDKRKKNITIKDVKVEEKQKGEVPGGQRRNVLEGIVLTVCQIATCGQ